MTGEKNVVWKRLATKVVRAGEPEPRIAGAVVTPIFQSAMFEYGGESDYHDLQYIRLNNTPNHTTLHAKLAALENAEAALVTASGMAAISTTLLTFLSPGDHLLVQDCLYGGTHDLVTGDLPRLGIEFDFVAGDDSGAWEEKLRPTTKAFYFESMSNPLLQVPDLEAGIAFARAHGLLTMIDNTFPSPCNFRPAEHGIDLSLHSCTKYLNGHSDIVAGAVIGRRELVEEVRRKLNHLGGSLDPHACFLLDRGIKTLVVRMRQHNESAQRLAEFLSEHPGVKQVNYPGLASHPQHALTARLFDGFSGMLSFEPQGGIDATRRYFEKKRLPVSAPSLGGVETLATIPATTSHAGMSPQDRQRLGITDSLIRISVGIESSEDLIEDFDRALSP
ncbi:MAG: cystathionine beta-lyase [Planctomycetes bacterium]|jgi:cystathionine beta-lyase/cystathionine gamma-synthase|nr:cystathionine beta-lyase [Planctomycetota bacterium]